MHANPSSLFGYGVPISITFGKPLQIPLSLYHGAPEPCLG